MGKIRLSLKVKMIGVVLAVALVIACTAVLVSYTVYANTMDTHYETLTMNLARTTASMLDKGQVQALTDGVMEAYRAQCVQEDTPPDFDSFTQSDWDAYYAAFDGVVQSEEYAGVLDVLEQIRQDNGIQSLYLCYMDQATGKAVYLVDASDPNDACLPGDCDDIEAGNLSLMEQGVYDFPAYITNYPEYGWLCSAAAAITDEDGRVIANAYVDISMNDVMQDRYEFLTQLLLILAGAALVLTVLLVLAITRTVVRPINRLSAAAGAFVSDKRERREGASAISRLEIHTGDEIENLSRSIQKMEQDINSYIDNLSRVTAEKERIGAELDVAAKIQADMLPCIFPAFPDRNEFDIYATMTPAKEVGGDFYDFFLVDDDHLAMVIADVSGKGVPAALFMVIAKTLLKNAAQTGLSPKAILEKVNNQLCENNEAEMFVTVWLGIYEISTGRLTAANAGHEYPAIRRAGGGFELVRDRHGFVLAGMENARYREYQLEIGPGDTLFAYTDGVAEATDGANTLYGTDRMLDALNAAPERSPEELLAAVRSDIDRFVGGAPQFDDITMLAIRRRDTGKETMKKCSVEPRLECMETVVDFFERELKAHQAPPKVIAQINVAIDEIFSNIARYSGATSATVGCEAEEGRAVLRFTDNGRPYDPTQQSDPDTTLGAEEREIGGLGIFMVKKTMDRIAYSYTDGMNVLTIEKSW